MIVVDSSVWIPFFNGKESPQTSQLRALLGEQPILIGDLVLCEILQGARAEKHAQQLREQLGAFDKAPMLDPELAVAAARNYRALRAEGVTIRKTIDLVIGTFCIEKRHALLHDDRDFEPMERYLGLEVIRADWSVNEPAPRYRKAR